MTRLAALDTREERKGCCVETDLKDSLLRGFLTCLQKSFWLKLSSGGYLLCRATLESKDRASRLLLFSHAVVSNSLRPHGPQHARLPCPSLSPRVCSNSCPLIQWCHPTISSSLSPPPLLSSLFPIIRIFSNELALHIRLSKHWRFSFSISPYNEHSRLIYSRTDWLDLCEVQETLKRLLQHHSSKALILWCSASRLEGGLVFHSG